MKKKVRSTEMVSFRVVYLQKFMLGLIPDSTLWIPDSQASHLLHSGFLHTGRFIIIFSVGPIL